MSLLFKRILEKIKYLNTEINKKNWITDTNNYKLTASNTTITIPYSFDAIDEFSFRILGLDSASFGFLNVVKDLWHNNGTYSLNIKVFRDNSNTVAGYASLVCQKKTDNSFQIKMSNSSCNSVVVSFKLK